VRNIGKHQMFLNLVGNISEKHQMFLNLVGNISEKHPMFLNLVGNIFASREANFVSATMFLRVGKHGNL
jgi:hypothetical protein